eukprot:1454200-Amphidinium_carterae.2
MPYATLNAFPCGTIVSTHATKLAQTATYLGFGILQNFQGKGLRHSPIEANQSSGRSRRSRDDSLEGIDAKDHGATMHCPTGSNLSDMQAGGAKATKLHQQAAHGRTECQANR